MTLSQAVLSTEASYQAGYDAGRRTERDKTDAIISAFDRTKDRPGAKIPTELALAIYNARTDEQRQAMYVDAGVQRAIKDQYEGRAEHDTDICGIARRAGL